MTLQPGKHDLRKALWEREDKCCWYCTRKTRLYCQENAGDRATIDHLIPKCRGGVDDDTNRVNCCLRCNGLKGLLTEAEFRSMSSVDALRFNDAAGRYGIKNLRIIHIAMAAGEGYRPGRAPISLNPDRHELAKAAE